jgi:tetratricopeptide (TPR) repeat protein
MSLLLEALKKAELAKKQAREDTEPAREDAPITSVMTKERLPDISQPLEILTDDLPSAGQRSLAAAAPTLSMESIGTPPPASRGTPNERPGGAAPADGPAISARRDAARQLFEVKEMDYNPRRPFYLTVTALATLAVGYGVYVWWQLQPKTNYAAAPVPTAEVASAHPPSLPPLSPEPVIAQPGSTTQPQAPAPQAPGSANASGSVPAIPAPASPVPVVTPVLRPPTTASLPVRTRERSFAEPASSVTGRAYSPGAAGTDGRSNPIAITPSSLQTDPMLERAYEAVQTGDFGTARDIYQRTLQRDPVNRDALLGLAAVDMKARNFDAAEARYARLLELDPRDSHAQAALIALRGQMDPLSSESRIKTLLSIQPDAVHLHFTLGNLYAAQQRWAEAQQAYFRAYTSDPENSDYAYNLAVALDRLHQRKPALDYYERALVLYAKRPGSFERAALNARIQTLQRAP